MPGGGDLSFFLFFALIHEAFVVVRELWILWEEGIFEVFACLQWFFLVMG